MIKKLPRTLTLTELLTAILAVGTLVAVFVPVLSAGRESADKAVCRSNLRQVAMAMLNYTRDNDGFLPGANWGRVSTGWLYAPDFDPDDESPKQIESLKNGQLWPYLKNPHVYRCPSDWRTFDTLLFQARGQRLSSYTMNGSVQGYSRGPVRNIEEFDHDAILFWEPSELSPFYFHLGANFPNAEISTRHGYGSHAAGADGHIEFMTEAEWEAESNLRPGRLWNDPWSATGG